MFIRQLCLWSLGISAIGLLWGCGTSDARPSAILQGTVTLNGKPLEEGSVRFTSTKTGETAYANLEAGGRYSVEMPEVDLGEDYLIAVGQTIVDETDAMALAANPPAPMTVKIPAKYAERTTSGLSLTIDQPGVHSFDIELKGS
ncbi:hypothetical protein M4951_00725 [Blastopirellula sp. J2-11]|uniref:hypothetical protein n=1 Tax=Blastopirellula sp. J2-11 TaxID=2943192 RepID=UPI0021C6709C|nr:hypothetical protein [Blastopirellula sp. J2-11]UUO06852.1 hypothetical protein M4951_00725 [Blastopirellula sp. J2-11]